MGASYRARASGRSLEPGDARHVYRSTRRLRTVRSRPEPAVARAEAKRLAAASGLADASVARESAGALDRVQRDPRPVSMWLGSRRPRRGRRLEGLDDLAVLRDEVRVALDAAAADHLHQQVHRQLAVEAREQRVAGEVDLELVEGGVRGVPLLVRDRGRRSPRAASRKRVRARPRSIRPTVRSAACSSSASRTSYPSAQRLRRHGRDVVAAASLAR